MEGGALSSALPTLPEVNLPRQVLSTYDYTVGRGRLGVHHVHAVIGESVWRWQRCRAHTHESCCLDRLGRDSHLNLSPDHDGRSGAHMRVSFAEARDPEGGGRCAIERFASLTRGKTPSSGVVDVRLYRGTRAPRRASRARRHRRKSVALATLPCAHYRTCCLDRLGRDSHLSLSPDHDGHSGAHRPNHDSCVVLAHLFPAHSDN